MKKGAEVRGMSRGHQERMALIARVIFLFYHAQRFGITLKRIRRKRSSGDFFFLRVKSVLTYFLVEYGFPTEEIAMYLSRDINGLSITRTATNIREQRGIDKALDNELDRIQSMLPGKAILSANDTDSVPGIARTPVKVQPQVVMRIVCRRYKMTQGMLCGGRRDKPTAHARAVLIYLLRKYTDLSFPKIGKFVGNRTHQPMIYNSNTIAKRLLEEQKLRVEIAELGAEIEATMYA